MTNDVPGMAGGRGRPKAPAEVSEPAIIAAAAAAIWRLLSAAQGLSDPTNEADADAAEAEAACASGTVGSLTSVPSMVGREQLKAGRAGRAGRAGSGEEVEEEEEEVEVASVARVAAAAAFRDSCACANLVEAESLTKAVWMNGAEEGAP